MVKCKKTTNENGKTYINTSSYNINNIFKCLYPLFPHNFTKTNYSIL